MTDKWRSIWDRQKQQQESFGLDPDGMTLTDKALVAKDLSLGLYEEVAELARITVHFKRHLLRVPPVDWINVVEEAADVLKYTIAIAQLHGVSAEDMFQAFMRKSAVVEDRAAGEQLELTEDTKVILVDLDNCIADITPLEETLGKIEQTAEREQAKADLRRTGAFRTLPVVDGAVAGMRHLRQLGYKLVIITARPYRQYKRLYADTMEWLKKHKIEYDLILFKRDKAEAISDYIMPAQARFFIEDRTKHALEIIDMNVPVLLLDAPYNQGVEHPLITRVENWGALISRVVEKGKKL